MERGLGGTFPSTFPDTWTPLSLSGRFVSRPFASIPVVAAHLGDTGAQPALLKENKDKEPGMLGYEDT